MKQLATLFLLCTGLPAPNSRRKCGPRLHRHRPQCGLTPQLFGQRYRFDFSATWCGPCWSYHESGVLEELYDTYGSDGTNELRVFFIEGDDGTTQGT